MLVSHFVVYTDMNETRSLDLQQFSTASRSRLILSAILHSSHYQQLTPVIVSVVKVKMLPLLGPCAFKQRLNDPRAFKSQINAALKMNEISDNIS